jgi:hypothetical protein
MKQTGEVLKDTLRQNQPVLMELQWGITDTFMDPNDMKHGTSPQPDPVEIQFWSTAYDPHVRVETYTDLRIVTNAFSEVGIHFVPRYSILDGERFHCIGTASDDSPCDHLCTNGGRYCTNHATDLSGRAIITESLRRLCVFDHSTTGNAQSGNQKHDMYWEYLLHHKKECSKAPHLFTDEACIAEAMKVAKLDAASIQACMISSGGTNDTALINNKLAAAIADQKRAGVVMIPSLVFNRNVLHRTSAYLLFEVICNEYWMSNVRTVPDICTKCSSCPNTVGCVENHGKCIEFNNHDRYIMPDTDHHESAPKSKNKKKSYFWSRLGWMVFFGCAFGAAYYYYDTHIKDARRSGSRPLMNDYLHLNMDG